jgi:hypothetical protein
MAARGVGYAGNVGVLRKNSGVLSVSAVLCCQTRNVVRWEGHIAEENMEGRILVGCRDWNAAAVSPREQLLQICALKAAEDSRVAEAVQHGLRVVG